MNAKEISQLENVELDDNALIPVYTESEGAGKTSLENVRKAMGVNSLTATIDELAPHSTPTADVEKKNVSDFSITFGIPKTNAIETHTVKESTDKNGLRKNIITDILSDATQKTYEVKDGIGIKETKVEQKDEDSQISKITLTFTDGSTKEVEVHNGKGIESIEYTPSNLSKGENKIKVKYSDGTESNRFTVLNGKDFRIVHSFKSEEEREKSDFKWTDEGGEYEIELFDFVMIDTGSVEDEESGRLYSCADKDGAKVWHYHGDISGCKGDSGTIEIGTVEKGENAEVENVGTPQSAILNFKLPKGDKGETGDSATVEVGTVETIAPDESASVENVGDEHNAIFNFKIPKGATGANAPVGSIISYAGAEAPAGWLMCDGTVYSGLTYPKLYAILPTEWKDLDNATFSIDLRGRFVEGADGNLGEYKEAGLPNITGHFGDWNQYTGERVGTGAFSAWSSGSWKGFSTSGNDSRTRVGFNASKGETNTDGKLKTEKDYKVYGKSDTVQPASLCLNYIIKATNTADNLEEIIDDSKIDAAHTWSSEKIKAEIGEAGSYSLTETIIGKWIDGKPLYKICGYCTDAVIVGDLETKKIPISWIQNLNIRRIIKFESMEDVGSGAFIPWRKAEVTDGGVKVKNMTNDFIAFDIHDLIAITYIK